MTITLQCYTFREIVAQTAPIMPATFYFPHWWRDLNKSTEENFYPNPTLKTCDGLIQYFKKSIAIPLWSDWCIDVDEFKLCKWQFSDMGTEALPHNIAQRGSFMSDGDHLNIKIVSPWICFTEKPVQFLMTHPSYHFNNLDIQVMNGVLDFSKQHGLAIQTMINLHRPRNEIIPFGQIMAFLTPLTEEPVVVERHIISQEEYMAIHDNHRPITFINKYKNMEKAKEFYSECPYSGGSEYGNE